jgi:hypothetical protein
MEHITLPADVTTIPLAILAMPITEFITTHIAPTPARTRFITGLLNGGVGNMPIWFFLAQPLESMKKRKHVGKVSIDRLVHALCANGAPENPIGSLLKIREIGKLVSLDTGQSYWFHTDVVLGVIAGGVTHYSHFASRPELRAALKGRGLRPSMRIEELFIYVPVVCDS